MTKYCAVIGTHSTVRNRVWPRETSAQRVVVDVNDDPTQGQMVEMECIDTCVHVCVGTLILIYMDMYELTHKWVRRYGRDVQTAFLLPENSVTTL